jgi:hypothetical protein
MGHLRLNALAFGVVVALAGAQSALAGPLPTTGGDPFVINNDYGTTGRVTVIGNTDFPATSVYTPTPAQAAGCANPAACTADELIGQNVFFQDTGTADVNVLLDGTVPQNTVPTNGFGPDGGNWNLRLSYSVQGIASFIDCLSCDGINTVGDGTLDSNSDGAIDTGFLGLSGGTAPFVVAGNDSLVPTFDTSGTSIIDVFYEDLANPGSANDGKQVLSLVVFDSEFTGSSVNLFTEVDYGFLGGGSDAFVENFFQFENAVNIGGTLYDTFYDIWEQGESGLYTFPIMVAAATDFNVEPSLVPVSGGSCPAGSICRSTDLNISTRFFARVPEPATLALTGMAMFGAGVAATRRRKEAA